MVQVCHVILKLDSFFRIGATLQVLKVNGCFTKIVKGVDLACLLAGDVNFTYCKIKMKLTTLLFS